MKTYLEYHVQCSICGEVHLTCVFDDGVLLWTGYCGRKREEGKDGVVKVECPNGAIYIFDEKPKNR
jgi:hypothetical protein